MPRDPKRTRLAALVAAALVAFAAGSAVVVVAAQANRGSAAAPLLPDLDQEVPSDLRLRTLGRRGASQLPPRLPVGGAERGGRRARDSRPALGGGDGCRPGDPARRRVGAGYPRRRLDRLRHVTRPPALALPRLRPLRAPPRRIGHAPSCETANRASASATATARTCVSPTLLPPRCTAAVADSARRGLSEIEEGISVGYGDAYSAFLEDQDLPLDGLSAGRYLLVHHVNADGRLHELSYENNSASVLLDLRWHRKAPVLRILARLPRLGRMQRPPLVRLAQVGVAVGAAVVAFVATTRIAPALAGCDFVAPVRAGSAAVPARRHRRRTAGRLAGAAVELRGPLRRRRTARIGGT